MGYKIGVDVGGTFTDFIYVDKGDRVSIVKVPTTPADESQGVMDGLAKIAQKEARPLEQLLKDTDVIIHGTTVATNTMLVYGGVKTGLLTTKGFRDDIELRRGFKEKLFDPQYPPPHPIVPRRWRIGINERIDARGEVIIPLDEKEVREAIRKLKATGLRAIAVSFLFSFLNPTHEKKVLELMQQEFPEAFVSLSHEVLPQVREFERVSSTVVNAYTGPILMEYLLRLENMLKTNGFQRELLVMQSNGGIMDVDFVSRNAVYTLLSGPAGGVIGSTYLGEFTGERNFITIDMGGTSYDVCLVRDCKPIITTDSWISRYRIAIPMLDIHTIGAGGGSIAWVDPGGALHVGPQSAGASPGPICYGRGGMEPTVTDANLVLGYINPDYFLGGEMKLTLKNVKEMIKEKVGDPLGFSVVEAVNGIFRIVNNNMANAIRVVSVQKGHDPRDFSLIAFGGNGAVHGGIQAKDLEIKKVLVPKMATAFSALGLLASDFRIGKVRTYMVSSAEMDLGKINQLYNSMREEVMAQLELQQLPSSHISIYRYIDFHYSGQTHEITTPVTCGDTEVTDDDLKGAIIRFHQLHEQFHTFSNPDQPVNLVSLRLEGIGITQKPKLEAMELDGRDPSGAIKAKRPVYFDDYKDFRETVIYDGNRVRPGNMVVGPCIIEEPATTIVVYPGQVATLNKYGVYEISSS